MSSFILSRFKINNRCFGQTLNYLTKSMTNWSQTTTKSIQFNNNNINNFVKYYPMIGNKIVFNENEIKINPILDKLEPNKCYILMNSSLNPMTKQINPILVPNLSYFQIKNINKNNEIDLENENQLINNKKELPPLKNGIKIYANYRRIRDPRAYTHLTIIRKRKMKKHQRKKWRKKNVGFH